MLQLLRNSKLTGCQPVAALHKKGKKKTKLFLKEIVKVCKALKILT